MLVGGIQFGLRIGPGIALPAPQAVLDALVSVQVTEASGEAESGFDLTFEIPRGSPLATLFLVANGGAIPLLRVVLSASIGGSTVVLMDGVVTQHQIEPGSPATLKIQGKDLSQVMSYLDFSGLPYPAMPPAARVLLILAKYAWLGMVPMVIPGLVEDLPLPIEQIPRQQGKDLDYVRRLARQAGYVFHVDPGPVPGAAIAYWGPELRVGPVQKALSVDMDAHTNVEQLSFRMDREAKEMPIVMIHEKTTKAPIPIPIPDVTPLNPPLGALPPLPPKITRLEDTARLSPGQAVMQGIAYAAQHNDSVFAQGRLDVLRYGRVLRARRLVGLRGAGLAFDGLWFVKRVTHEIRRGAYAQSFELARNGVVSTVASVPA